MAMLDAALAHAARRRPVFPCGADKRPLTEHGFKDATTDQARITEWWQRWPEAFIGMPTGRASGVFVLDVDTKNGHDGEGSLQALQATNAALPATVEAFTPSGGRHLYFRMPHGVEIKNSAGKLGDGLDVRGDGGYVILPPSGSNGHAYAWELSSDPDEDAHAAEPPPWLLRLIAAPKAEQREQADGDIRDGQRNAVLTSMAGSMRRRGMSADAILAALRVENAARCSPPLADDEVQRIAASVGRYAPEAAANRWRGPDAARVAVASLTGEPYEPPDVVAGLTPRDAGSLIAPGGLGKTTLALWEGVHITLGRPLYGHPVEQAGGVLVVSAEDDDDTLKGRLNRICRALELSDTERQHVAANFYFEDISAEPVRFAVHLPEGIVRTPAADELVEKYRGAGLSMVYIDPVSLCGPGEEWGNDGMAELLRTARYISRNLGAAVRLTHHVSKVVARDNVVDPYVARGGGAFADNGRFTHQLVPVSSRSIKDDKREWFLPVDVEDEELAEGRVFALFFHKHSYRQRRLVPVILVRQGFDYLWANACDAAPTVDTDAQVEAAAERLLEFIRHELAAGIKHTPRSLEDATDRLGLKRAALRDALHRLKEKKRLHEHDLPKAERIGQRTKYLSPEPPDLAEQAEED